MQKSVEGAQNSVKECGRCVERLRKVCGRCTEGFV